MFIHISCAAMFLFTPSFDIFSPFLAIYQHVSTAITKSAPQNIAWHWQICERYRAYPLYVFAYIPPMAHTRRAESRAHYHCIYCLRCRISSPFTASIAAARAHICLFAHAQARTFRMHIRQKQAGSHARPRDTTARYAQFIYSCLLQFFAISSSSIGTALRSSPAICPRIS